MRIGIVSVSWPTRPFETCSPCSTAPGRNAVTRLGERRRLLDRDVAGQIIQKYERWNLEDHDVKPEKLPLVDS